jgi:hypothetical protein
MQSIVKPVKEIDPKTGLYVEPKEIPKHLTVQHYLNNTVNPIHPLNIYKSKGVKNMTQDEVDEAYTIIKGFKHGKQFN